MLSRTQAVLVSIGFALLTATGCSATTDDASSSEAAVTSAGLHEPQGDERKAIFAAFREVLAPELQGQEVVFNNTNPVGRFQAHGDWASYEGVLEGPNATTIDYSKSVYKDAAEGGYLDGVQINGRFAAKFFALAQKGADGTWHVGTLKDGQKTYAVGPGYEAWATWASAPPVAQRDVSRAFPKDDRHEPQGVERAAIIAALHAVIDPTLNGQSCAFNSNEPVGRFQSHDGWAYYEGIIEGPNGNATAINYSSSSYSAQSSQSGFEGVLKGGNFAAKVSALFQQQADGSWKVAKQGVDGAGGNGFAVGVKAPYFGDTSQFAGDIFSAGCGNGDGGDGDGGDGDGDGDGDGNGGNGNGNCGDGDGDGDGGGNGNGDGG